MAVKTYVPQLARIATRLTRYVNKHNATLQANMQSANYQSLINAVANLSWSDGLINEDIG